MHILYFGDLNCSYPLAAVTELTMGPRARSVVTLLLDLTVFGCGIPNLLVGR